MKKLFVLFLLTCTQFCAIAQSLPSTDNNYDFMRSNGKIFVVMAVVLVILIGLFAYLFSIDRKITKLENK